MQRGTRRRRGNLGGPAGRTNERRTIKAIENKDLRWTKGTPPIKQPKVNRSFTFPLTVHLGQQYAGTATAVLWRLEDVIKGVQEVVGLTASWVPNLTIRIMHISLYGVVEAIDSNWATAFTSTLFDPMTNQPVLTDAVVGSINEMPRISYHPPMAVTEHLFGWDGVSETSANLFGVHSTDTFYLAAYVNVVVYIQKVFTPTWTKPLWINTELDAFSSLEVSSDVDSLDYLTVVPTNSFI